MQQHSDVSSKLFPVWDIIPTRRERRSGLSGMFCRVPTLDLQIFPRAKELGDDSLVIAYNLSPKRKLTRFSPSTPSEDPGYSDNEFRR